MGIVVSGLRVAVREQWEERNMLEKVRLGWAKESEWMVNIYTKNQQDLGESRKIRKEPMPRSQKYTSSPLRARKMIS